MLLDKPNLDYIKYMYKNTKLKKIVNVYQKEYINIKAQGFGDFLRGSIYLTYVCMVLGLDFDIDIKNHPMSMYLKNDISLYIYTGQEIEQILKTKINKNRFNEISACKIYKPLIHRHNAYIIQTFNNHPIYSREFTKIKSIRPKIRGQLLCLFVNNFCIKNNIEF